MRLALPVGTLLSGPDDRGVETAWLVAAALLLAAAAGGGLVVGTVTGRLVRDA